MESELRFCDQCGFEAGTDARFCPSCGASLHDDAAAPKPPPPTPNPQARQLNYDQGRQLARSLQGRSQSRWRRRGRMLKALVALAAVGLIFGVYNAAAAMTYSDARAAHLELDCSSAADKYGRVASFFALSIATPRSEASRRQAECDAVVEAEVARDDGDHEAAAGAYENALVANPESPIRETIERWHGDELLEQADAELVSAWSRPSAGDLYDATTLYARVRDEYEGQQSAARAGSALSNIERRLRYQAGVEPCSTIPFYEGLGSELRRMVAAGLPVALLGCAGEHLKAKRYVRARELYKQLVLDYPGSNLEPRARRGLIVAEVGVIRSRRTGDLGDPVTIGSSGSSDVRVSVQNSSPYPLELLLSGPDAQRLPVPACDSCPEYSQSSEFTSCSGPERSVVVRPGRYAAVVRSKSKSSVRSWSDDWTLIGGYRYDAGCFYIVTSG